jgi:hypothetical protein
MAKNTKKPILQNFVKQNMDLFYMTPNSITAADISLVFDNQEGIRIELWKEMNILELELISGGSIDFEPINLPFSNSHDEAFTKNRGIKTVFSIQVEEGDFLKAKSLFELMIEKYSGFICSDTENFQPLIVGTMS